MDSLVGYAYDPEAVAEAADWGELFLGGRLPERLGRLGEAWLWPRVVLARAELEPVFEGMKVVRQQGGMVAVGTDARRWRRGRP